MYKHVINNLPLWIIIILAVFSLYIPTSCTPKQDIPDWVTDTPTLKFVKMSDSIFHFNDTSQYFIIDLVVYDKDQDLGTDISDTTVIIKDYRSDTLFARYRVGFPMIDKSLIENGYLHAGVKIRLPPGAIRPRTDPVHLSSRKDTCYLLISVVDESGKLSNEDTTPKIYIRD